MTIGMGGLSLLLVIPAVAFAAVAVIAIALVSLFRSDISYSQKQFRHLVEFYRKHRMYQ
jgi:hypothetical protein